MPKYMIGLPDGRTMEAEAANEAEALAGAQSWYAGQQQKPKAETPPAAPPPAYGYETSIPTWEQMGDKTSAADFADQIGQGFFMNYGDELAAAAGALPNILTGGRYGKPRQQILDEFRQREATFEKEHPGAATIGELGGAAGSGILAGSMGAARLLGQAPGVLRSTGVGALMAAPFGAVDATGRLEGDAGVGDYASAAAKGGLTAGAVGAGVGGGLNLLGRVIGPWAQAAAQRLSDRGIRLTPGQLLGGTSQRVEEITQDVPFSGQMLRNRMSEGTEDFNRVAINDALTPLENHFPHIFRRYGRADAAGRDLVNDAHMQAANALDDVVPRMRGDFDATLASDISGIINSLPQSEQRQFERVVMEYLSRADRQGNGTFRGRSMQDVITAMRDESQRWGKSAEPGTFSRELSQAYRDVGAALEMNLERHTAPDVLEAYRAANHAYRNMITIEQASGMLGTEEGVFRGSQLLNAVKATDQSVRRNRFARGQAGDLQDLAEDAKTVMGEKVRNSGSAERYFMQNLPYTIGAAAYGTGNPYVLAGIPAVLGMHTRPVHRGFQALATGDAPTRMLVRRAIERAAATPTGGLIGEKELADAD